MNSATSEQLDIIDHIAIQVNDIEQAVQWYRQQFNCTVNYQDDTWAFLEFGNIKLAFVIANQHPPHLAFIRSDAEKFGPLKTHRDGTRSVYIEDPSANKLEIMAADK